MPYIGKSPPVVSSSLEDADGDTKIQVEESADEDIIRFDVAGAEDLRISANSINVLSGTTLNIDSGATIANAGTATGFSASTLAASTTVGTGAEADTKIVFDGHAQDYYIGLDDTDDDFKIGLGSAVGTTAHMVFDETGAITKPLQPCVLAKVASKQTNVGGADTETDIPFGTEIFDQNSDFASPSFTAPVTGKYLMLAEISITQIDTDATFYMLVAVASNRTLYAGIIPANYLFSADAKMSITASQIIDMDVNDTLKIRLSQSDGATQTDIETESQLSICLIA